MKRMLIAGAACLAAAILSTAANRNAYPLPEERGTAGILHVLDRLPVSARVLWVQAHPDDESAGTITWLARRAHVRTAIYSFTRGEGGQNILGDEKYDALAVVRTGEFLEACRIYGAELYFGGQPDFGFSKSAEETLQKWGHDKALQGLVTFVRVWKPNVIISSFRGDSSDGHGHHQASGMLAREAFRAAGAGGAGSWKVSRLFVRSSGSGASVQIPVGEYDPVLGRSYREIGAEGYAKHRTQSMGAGYAPPGASYDSFRLVEPAPPGETRSSNFPAGLPVASADVWGQLLQPAGMAAAGPDFTEVRRHAEEAIRLFSPRRPSASLPPLLRGMQLLSKPPGARSSEVTELGLKLQEFEDAASAVLGVYLTAGSGVAAAAPGETVPVSISFFNRGSETVTLESISLGMPNGWSWARVRGSETSTVAAGGTAEAEFAVQVPLDAVPTNPFTLPEQCPVTATARYRVADTPIRISAPLRARAGDPIRGVDFVDFQVVPPLSISLTPEVTVVPLDSRGKPRELRVALTNFDPRGSKGSLRLGLPAGWSSEPERADFALPAKGETSTIRFRVRAAKNGAEGTYTAEAIATAGGREYRSGCQVISYPEIWTRYLHKPAKATIRVMDLKVAPNLTVAYVPGTGDQVPDSLSQMGMRIEALSGDDLAFGDLSRFAVIVTGIRAYNVNQALRANNRRLLGYAEDGGTVIVQYNTPLRDGIGGRDGSQFPFGPFPMANSTSDRITVEDSPVSIVAPGHPALLAPNKIVASDFDGWVQERGLYFMRSWDPRYTALLSSGDPGEEPLKGGLLVARVGKGWYVFTGYAWFRQLPAGVPGAYRIFANLLSLGR